MSTETNRYIIRRAMAGDSHRVWEIRNHPATRANSNLQVQIALASHIVWFYRNYFENTDNFCFVLESASRVVGYCRFDLRANGSYLSSIAIDPALWGQGLAGRLLNESLQQISQPGRRVLAEIHKANIASIKLFTKNGFDQTTEDGENLYFTKSF